MSITELRTFNATPKGMRDRMSTENFSSSKIRDTSPQAGNRWHFTSLANRIVIFSIIAAVSFAGGCIPFGSKHFIVKKSGQESNSVIFSPGHNPSKPLEVPLPTLEKVWKPECNGKTKIKIGKAQIDFREIGIFYKSVSAKIENPLETEVLDLSGLDGLDEKIQNCVSVNNLQEKEILNLKVKQAILDALPRTFEDELCYRFGLAIGKTGNKVSCSSKESKNYQGLNGWRTIRLTPGMRLRIFSFAENVKQLAESDSSNTENVNQLARPESKQPFWYISGTYSQDVEVDSIVEKSGNYLTFNRFLADLALSSPNPNTPQLGDKNIGVFDGVLSLSGAYGENPENTELLFRPKEIALVFPDKQFKTRDQRFIVPTGIEDSQIIIAAKDRKSLKEVTQKMEKCNNKKDNPDVLCFLLPSGSVAIPNIHIWANGESLWIPVGSRPVDILERKSGISIKEVCPLGESYKADHLLSSQSISLIRVFRNERMPVVDPEGLLACIPLTHGDKLTW